ncbi:hypothetical protein HYDPIDRAFT_167498 [Hydnomerulius pinastri MD-312]|uniref:Uncharacterized protein n=1 Tax=Hydnomerulius pinastri MD-312 TaxID=994086 RepID=A0A0C9WFY6_9AGAM|nr:hypothetical protein HYDPIDRAFT_167498 [Hydnomerulius pinastri MD-312]
MARQPTKTMPPAPNYINTDSGEKKRDRPISSSSSDEPNTEGPPPKRTNIVDIDDTNNQDPTPLPQKSLKFRKMPSVTGTRTLASGLVITAPPKGGFPKPQLGEPIWRNVSATQKLKWPQKKGPKAWVCVFRATYEPNAQATVEKLRDIIPKIVGSQLAQNLVLSTPTAETALHERLPPPYHFLISGLLEEQIVTLLELEMCSCKEVTCFFIPYEMPLPTYIRTLENFSFPDNENSNIEIADIVKKTIRAQSDIMSFIHNHIETPDAEAAIKAVDTIRVTSLRVTATSNLGKRTIWNVYCDSPPKFTVELYYKWTALIRGLSFVSEDNGTAAVRLRDCQFKCIQCKPFDHPTWACPFNRLQGWFGPSPPQEETITMMDDEGSPQKAGKTQSTPTRKNTPRGRGRVTRRDSKRSGRAVLSLLKSWKKEAPPSQGPPKPPTTPAIPEAYHLPSGQTVVTHNSQSCRMVQTQATMGPERELVTPLAVKPPTPSRMVLWFPAQGSGTTKAPAWKTPKLPAQSPTNE